MHRVLSAVMRGRAAVASSPLEQRLRRLSASERLEEARAFQMQFHAASGTGRAGQQHRWAEIMHSLRRHGWYEHTPEELAFGARLAWRNSGRCIGRLFWKSLEVIDCRAIVAPDAIAARMHDHLAEAQSDGRIRSIISVFAPVMGPKHPAWIESPQLVHYAGHSQPDGRILGDRMNVEATRIARSMGWSTPDRASRFDILPWLLRDAEDRRHLFALPDGAVREVPILHPKHPALAELGLRWYAVPVVTNMVLTIGGIDYPCAPFNGFYMGTEIASRNFADRQRFDMLAVVAQALGLVPDTARDPLWRDTALTELNRAVLYGFRNAGVTMIDHHAASEQFMTFHAQEQSCGRRVAGDWRWLVPPQAGSASDVFHLRIRNFHPVPNFYHDRGSDGLRLMPWYGDRDRRRVSVWTDRLRRRWKIWKRMAW